MPASKTVLLTLGLNTRNPTFKIYVLLAGMVLPAGQKLRLNTKPPRGTMATTTNRLRWQPQAPCAASLARVVQQDGIWPGLTAAGARLARRMATEDGEVPTSDSPTLSLHQRLSLAHPVAAGRYDTLHPDLDPFWQWVAMKQARENPGSRLWSACDEARREYRKLCRQWELRSAPANTPTGAETP